MIVITFSVKTDPNGNLAQNTMISTQQQNMNGSTAEIETPSIFFLQES